jgi:uncharacterized membrane protein
MAGCASRRLLAQDRLLSSRLERSGMEGSAVLRWLSRYIVSLTAAALVFLALSPSWLRARGYEMTTLAVFAFFSKVCHQRPDRVIYLSGEPTAVCVRCLGIYAGAAIGGLAQWSPRLALRCFGVTLTLNGLDVAAETLGLHNNLPLLRLLIGAALGIATAALITTSYCGDKAID